MKKLYDTSENNFLKFNEVVPYYSNDWKIQSPKLATMLLELGPQIEAMSKIIFEELKLKHEKKKKNSRHYFHDYYLKSAGVKKFVDELPKDELTFFDPFVYWEKK